MTDVFKLLTYIINNHGYWAAIAFISMSAVPLLTWGYITLSQSSIGKAIDKKFSEKLKEEKITHRHGNRLRKQFDKDVVEILQDLAEETNADRAIVFEFSNGTSNLIGLPFLYMTVAAEVASPGLSLIASRHQRLNTSIISRFLTRLEREGSIFISTTSEEVVEFKLLTQIMERANIGSAIFVSIQGIDEAIGFLVLITNKESGAELDQHNSFLLASKAGQRIGSMINFDEITEKEKRKAQKTKWSLFR